MIRRLKILLVLEETYFYQAAFAHNFLRNTRHEVVGAILVTKPSEKADIEKFLLCRPHWLFLREMLFLASLKWKFILQDLFLGPFNERYMRSVKSVLRRHGIMFREVQRNINRPEHLEWIASRRPDVIVSSCSLIFGKKLLHIPKICCINRHSSLLPAYGGIWPVLQAYANNETHTGVSIHIMEESLDKGNVLAQAKIPIREGHPLTDLYERCFALSVDVLNDALGKIAQGDFSDVAGGIAPSYFSFPTKEQWSAFRKRKGRFI